MRTPEFTGLALNFIGLYQLNVQVPSDLAANPDTRLRLKVGERFSKEVLVAVE